MTICSVLLRLDLFEIRRVVICGQVIVLFINTLLNTAFNINLSSQGIVSLSLLFETLLQTHEPQLFYHLKSVGVQP